MNEKPINKNLISVIVLAAVFIIIAIVGASSTNTAQAASSVNSVSYTEFQSMVDKGEVTNIIYSAGDNTMTFTTDSNSNVYYSTTYPDYDDFKKDMLEKGINVRVTSGNLSSLALANILVVVLILGGTAIIARFFMKNNGGVAASSSSNSSVAGKENTNHESTSNVKFDDIIGQDEVIEDIRFITELIKNPEKGERMGAKAPKGILLQGPPGTGKTLIAKAIAGEASVPFLYASASSFAEMYVGVGAKRIRQLFAEAKKKAPCVVFIDEIDAIGGNRNAQGRNSEDDKTINEFLTCMDGFDGREGVFVIAATNNAEKLDKAFIRPGRFDRQVTVAPPRDWTIREKMFRMYLKDAPLGEDVSYENISKETAGFTGADIAASCNEAKIIAIMSNKDYIDMDCLEEAIDKKVFKGNRSKEKSKLTHDREVVAYHEAGHAVMTFLTGNPIARASIVGTTSGVGGAVFQEERNTVFETEQSLKQQVMIAYAGRASEEIKFTEVTTGASNDITQATNIIAQYIERYGFDKEFGLVDLSLLQNNRMIDGASTVKKISEMSTELYNDTLETLRREYSKVEALATALLERETMSGEEIEALIA